jgi:putative glutathione S-transferase
VVPTGLISRRSIEEREMGLLVDGAWHDTWYDTGSTGGRFVRKDSAFRNWVTADGRPGPSGEDGFRAEPGRYHLYVSLACPWAHRTLIFRALKGLERMIDVSGSTG